MGWWIAGGLLALWVVYRTWARWDNSGQHCMDRVSSSDHIPTGMVWMRDGQWYTQPRRDWPTPRLFDKRHNPLDREYRWERVAVPPQFRDVPHEEEY